MAHISLSPNKPACDEQNDQTKLTETYWSSKEEKIERGKERLKESKGGLMLQLA